MRKTAALLASTGTAIARSIICSLLEPWTGPCEQVVAVGSANRFLLASIRALSHLENYRTYLITPHFFFCAGTFSLDRAHWGRSARDSSVASNNSRNHVRRTRQCICVSFILHLLHFCSLWSRELNVTGSQFSCCDSGHFVIASSKNMMHSLSSYRYLKETPAFSRATSTEVSLVDAVMPGKDYVRRYLMQYEEEIRRELFDEYSR